ncbi:MAG: DegV family protein [Lachnospiraceae bacterium]|jgi:DegV family protein with EDD domain|nr:DegV family protein [Lachnospiraceae bacterium]
MSFAVFADGTANLPKNLLGDIRLLPCEYLADGQPQVYHGDVDSFDGHAFYESLKAGSVIQTSLLNTDLFLTHFEPVLKEGRDIIYISMSSGISGTFNAARIAAEELMEKYSERFIHIVDSLGCGFGNGILALRAEELGRQGRTAREAAAVLDDEVPHVCQYFTVDDLNFLKRTGRVSGITASIGTVLNIKPILFGDATGHIISCAKVRGRRKSIEALAQKYEEKRKRDKDQRVFISHGDCSQDAQTLAGLIREITPDASITVCQHEPFSGAHVGPGMLGLFFYGVER